MTLAEAVSKRTQSLLIRHNMTQYRLVKLTNLDKSTLQTIFKGKTKDVRLSTVSLIAHALGMELYEFFNDEMFKYENLDI